MDKNFKERLADVEALVFDVDGVFTDGGITPRSDGDFQRTYYAKDGYAVAYAIRNGMKVCIITGGRGENLKRRFDMLHVEKTYINISDKLAVLDSYIEQEGLDRRNVVFMGDDIPDLEAMASVGIPVCPADAADEVAAVSKYVSQYPGGHGCVRDIIEQVLRAKGLWARDSKGVNCVSA